MTRWDKIIIVSVLLIGFTGMFLLSLPEVEKDEKYVSISVNGRETEKILVSKNDKNRIIEFEFEGGVGSIEINEGAVRMLEMDRAICPEGICSNTGWITRKHQTIICLPNKIAVSFDSQSDDGLDGISY